MNTSRGKVDAELLVPYLVLVLVTAFHELYTDESMSNKAFIMDPRTDGFRVRLLLMEHFTMHRVSMEMADYSYVTFKEVEQQIIQAEVATV